MLSCDQTYADILLPVNPTNALCKAETACSSCEIVNHQISVHAASDELPAGIMQQWAAEEIQRDFNHWQSPHGLPDQAAVESGDAEDAGNISFQDIKWSLLGPCKPLSYAHPCYEGCRMFNAAFLVTAEGCLMLMSCWAWYLEVVLNAACLIGPKATATRLPKLNTQPLYTQQSI